METVKLSKSAATNAAMQKEIDEAVKKITGLIKQFDKKTQRKILKPAAKQLQKAAKNNIPDSEDTHFRYNTPKVFNNIRAPKGKGKIVAAYAPGNLRRSINILLFRRSAALFVGPRVAKGTGGEFRGSRVDGYYAHWMEFGTKNFGGISYMRRAVDGQKNGMVASITKEVTDEVEKYKRKKEIK